MVTPAPDENARYTSIVAPVMTEAEIKRSRFLCYLAPAADEDAARAVVAAAKAEHPKGRHHCSAFVIGPRQELRRTNDDGEPSGTAGAPMLEALLGAGLSDVSAVVVRYFGGILLGAGGLTRAYRGAVADAIAAASLRERVLRLPATALLDYAAAAAMEAEARRRGWALTGAEYGRQVALGIAVPPAEAGELTERLAALSLGAGRLEWGEPAFVDAP